MTLYTDIDAKCCAWLRELVRAGALPPGEVQQRDVKDFTPDELRPFHQAHFFCGIGGWPLALRLAGYDGPCWTASLPCQPFSAAGKRLGERDERHLWPVFRGLVQVGRPPVLLGEQVASKAGRAWLAGVRADLEAMGYAVGAADLCAASVGSPHIRQRLFWGAGRLGHSDGAQVDAAEQGQPMPSAGLSGRGMGDADQPRPQGRHSGELQERAGKRTAWSASSWHPCRDGKHRRVPLEPAFFPLAHGVPARVVRLRGYGNAIVPQVAAEFVTAWMEAAA